VQNPSFIVYRLYLLSQAKSSFWREADERFRLLGESATIRLRPRRRWAPLMSAAVRASSPACYTFGKPHNIANQTTQRFSYFKPPTVPITLTTDRLQLSICVPLLGINPTCRNVRAQRNRWTCLRPHVDLDMFDISPARLHDREQPNAVGHQILRSPGRASSLLTSSCGRRANPPARARIATDSTSISQRRPSLAQEPDPFGQRRQSRRGRQKLSAVTRSPSAAT